MEIPYDPSIAHLSMRPRNILHHSDPSNPYISYLTLSEFYVARSERCQRKKLTIQALVTLVWFQWALNISNKREFGGSWRPFPSAISYWGKFLNIRVWICHIVSVTLSSTCATDSPVSEAIWLMSITSRNCGKAQNRMEKRAEWHLAEHTMGIGVFLPQTGRASPWTDTVKGVVTKAPFLQKHHQTHSLQIHTDTKANFKCIVALRQTT